MRDRWKDCSDEELIIRLREGEQEVMDYLMDKYKNLVRDKAKSMYILGGDTEDLIQEGMIGLFKAVRDYDFGRDAGFSTFATLCISRQMYTAVQASGRKNICPLIHIFHCQARQHIRMSRRKMCLWKTYCSQDNSVIRKKCS